jgi:hypothetical protein
MKWLLIAVFIQPSMGGGISVQQVPITNEYQCAQAIKALSAAGFQAGGGLVFAGATCIEVKP